MSEQPETPKSVQKHANENVRLPAVAVLGIFGRDANFTALIRTRNGETSRVQVGDRVNGGTVEAIGADRVVINRLGRAQVMKLLAG